MAPDPSPSRPQPPAAAAATPRSLIRALVPREHGLWCWVGAPLLGAVLLAPGAVTGGGAVAILAWFGAGNAARRGQWLAASLAGLIGGLAALPTGLAAAAPAAWWGTLLGLAAGGGLMVGLAAGRSGRRAPGALALELLAIGGFVAVGAGLATAGGAPRAAVALLAIAIATWEVTGLWWVRGQLARVLVGRTPWRGGPWAIAALALGLATAAALAGQPAVVAVPLLYALRIGLTRPATAPRDARRIGLGEAAWAAGATLLAASLAQA